MKLRVFLLLSVAGLLGAQNGPVIEREAPVTSVPFERILNAAKEPQNWLTYSGGYASDRYSELTKITPENVKDLTLKWVFQSRSLEKHEVTPLVVDGVMYTVQSINDVVALDAVTGKPFWTHTYKPDPEARNCCGQMTRGLAIQGDKLFLATLDAHMIALNAKTGKEIWNVAVADPKEKYSFTHAPLVIKDKVIEGTAGGEFGIRGFIAAFDVNTGKEAWRFYTVPGPGEPGHETWAGDSWKHGGAPDLGYRVLRPANESDLLGNRQPGSGLERRRTARRQPLQLFRGGARRRYREAQMALPVLAAQRVRLGFRADSRAGRYPMERQAAKGDGVGEPQRDVLCTRPDDGRVSARQAFRQGELGYRFRRERPADSGRRRRAIQRGHSDLSGEPGRDELVQPVLQSEDRPVLYPELAEQLDHLR